MLKSFWEGYIDSIGETKERNPIYFSLLKDARLVEMKDGELVLSCANSGAKKYLEKKKAVIEKSLSEYAKQKIKISVLILSNDREIESPLLRFEPSKEDLFRRAGLRLGYTFENFAVSSTNQIAFAAAQSVGKNPGSSYNPLFLYGGVGVGKTHLAQAIARVVIEEHDEKSVLFCSGEAFMNELIESIRGKTTQRFRKKYRALRLLVVDDIQFIAGKQTAQEEFFHTFNSIVSVGGQVILTSDRPPHEIQKLEDRLRSRFSGGLSVDIQPPDFELRTAILLIKSKEKNIEIDISSAKAIAEIVTDTRSLEGALLSLYAKSVSSGQKIELELVEEFFKSKLSEKKKKILPHDVIRCVCAYYGVTQAQIKGESRKRPLAHARQVVMYMLRTELGIGLSEIAFIVRRKDHTTVIHAVDKIQSRQMKDPFFRKEMSSISESLSFST